MLLKNFVTDSSSTLHKLGSWVMGVTFESDYSGGFGVDLSWGGETYLVV